MDARSWRRAGRFVRVWGGEGRGETMYRFVHACPGTDDICASEFFGSYLEHAF